MIIKEIVKHFVVIKGVYTEGVLFFRIETVKFAYCQNKVKNKVMSDSKYIAAFLKSISALFTVLCSATIIIPTIMDLNQTHMTNPQWQPHARLHWAIQYLSITTIQCLALFLLWGDYADKNSILIT